MISFITPYESDDIILFLFKFVVSPLLDLFLFACVRICDVTYKSGIGGPLARPYLPTHLLFHFHEILSEQVSNEGSHCFV